jgi:hypothetical protein
MNQLKDVKAKVRSLLGDPDGDWLTDAYLLPLINQAYEQQVNTLSATCSTYITAVRQIPAIPVGTIDLSEWQKDPKQPLYGMVNPLILEWKQAGQPDNYYVQAERVDVLPNITPATPTPVFCLYWEWRSYTVFVTPLNFPADFRMRGEFRPAPLLKDDDIVAVHPLMANSLAYATAALAASERGNATWVQTFTQQAVVTLDDIAGQLVRAQQGTTIRIGRANPSHSNRWW